jgi:polysaccharide pyruvyl transferase WcaK-like protein
VIVSADPAFLIDASEGADRQPRGDKPVVGFCLRHLADDRPGLNLSYLLPVGARHRLGLRPKEAEERDEELAQTLANAVRLCVEEFGAEVAMIPLWPGRDDEVLRAVQAEAEKLGVSREAFLWEPLGCDPQRVAGYVDGLDLLVSMRLHALVFAARQGVPALALSYVGKVRGLMRLLAREHWVVEVQTSTPSAGEIEMKLRGLWESRQAEAKHLKAAGEWARRRAEEDADRIVALLDS